MGMTMDRDFVERRGGSFYLIGSRVPLAHLVREFQQGEALEGHRSEVESDIAEREREEDAYTAAHPPPPEGHTEVRAQALDQGRGRGGAKKSR